MENKDKNLIPIGPYCYTYKDSKYIPCPYFKIKNINSIPVSWCDYLGLGGITGDHNAPENQYEKLLEYYKTEEAMDKELPLSLLFDQCKECGENDPDDFDETYGRN